MTESVIDIPTGLRIPAQIPFDNKVYFLSEAILLDLGVDDNLVYSYFKGMQVYCAEEDTRYEWRDMNGELEDGLLPFNFTYPAVWIKEGIDYSNKEYNFVKLVIPPFQKIDEGNGIGIVIRGRNPLNFGNIGLDAFDISTSTGLSNIRGATGSNSFASGDDVSVSGFASTVMGNLLDNKSHYGFLNGVNSVIDGETVSAFGIGHDVTALTSFVIGQASNIINNSLLDHNAFPLKELFVIGNGTIQNNDDTYTVLTRSNAFIVRYNGVGTLPSVTNALILAEPTGKALITREYLESDTPLQKIDEGNGIGIIIRNRIGNDYVAIGLRAIDLSYSGFPFHGAGGAYSAILGGLDNFIDPLSDRSVITGGSENTISLDVANVIGGGEDNVLQGRWSVIGGGRANQVLITPAEIITHNGNVSTIAGGFGNVISSPKAFIGGGSGNVIEAGAYGASILGGGGNRAKGHNSAVLGGIGLIAYSFSEAILGCYSTVYVPSSINTWVGTDRILVVGSGTEFVRSDAFVILKNGLATLPKVTNALITAEVTGKAVVTKEYLNSVIPAEVTVLRGVITQIGVNDPTLTSSKNNTGGTITSFVRNSPGDYTMTTSFSTVVTVNFRIQATIPNTSIWITRLTATTFRFLTTTTNGFLLVDDAMLNCPFEMIID